MREQIKKQISEALDSGTQIDSPKFPTEQLSHDIENEIFELTGKNSKDKTYREKTKRIIARLKGNRNQIVRNVLKNGVLLAQDFTKLSDKEIDDDNYFNKFASSEETNVTKGPKGITKPPRIAVPNVDLNKSK
jgi:hypothetical protein